MSCVSNRLTRKLIRSPERVKKDLAWAGVVQLQLVVIHVAQFLTDYFQITIMDYCLT